jgi:TonB family protein
MLAIGLLPSVADASRYGAPVREYGGAIPIAESRWITAADYPHSALRQQLQERVVAAFTISADGKIVGCSVEASSGSPILDAVPCKALQRRARFKPRSSTGGSAVEAKERYSVDVWLPD